MECVRENNVLSNINGFKAFLLFIIFLGHAGLKYNHIAQRACDFLFVFSGYLIAYKYLDNSEDMKIIPYIKKKIVKFYPLHFIGCIICCVAISDYNDFYIGIRQGIYSLLVNLTLLQSYLNQPYSFNSVAWFLSSLMSVYAIAPFTIKIIKKVNSIKIYSLLFIFIWLTRLLLEISPFSVNIYHFPVFAILTAIGGMLLYPLSQKTHQGGYIINSIIEIFLLIIVANLGYAHDDIPISIQMIFIWSASYVLILNNDIISSVMKCKMWNMLSKIQMEFYLLHQIVIRFFVKFGVNNLIIKIVLSFIVTFLLATLYLKYIEKYLNKFMCKILKISA